MWRLAILVTGACSTTSSTGFFVSDVRIEGERLAVLSCEQEYNVGYVGRDRYESLQTGGCSDQSFDLPAVDGLVLAAPPGCAGPTAMWESVADGTVAERRHVWASLPPACRAYLDEAVR